MNFLKKLIEFILRLLGIAPQKEGLIALNANGELNFDADTNVNISDVCAVFASYERDPARAVNALVRFKVLKGPFVFQTNDSTEVEVATDNKGKASVEGHFTSKGFAVLVAELVEDRKASVFFRGHSEGVTDQIFIYTEPCISANPGEVTAKIVALDRHGIPITGADIHFEGAHSDDHFITGTVREIGNGTYEGTFQTHIAGSYRVMAQDLNTHVLTYTYVEILPGAPHKFEFIGDTDPRVSQPYGELLLRAQLQDEFGNGLDPGRTNCQVNGQPLSPLTVFGREARFPIRLAGFGNADVRVNDSGSSIENNLTVQFASAWIQDPGLVFTGDSFSTYLYWLPPTDRPVQKATIELTFNTKLAAYKGFRSTPEGPMNSSGAEVENNLVTIAIASEVPVSAKEYPDGICIGCIDWDCMEEGETCFNLVSIMSPATPGWEKCVEQKKREENRKCLCVNIIYMPGDTAGRDAGITAAEQVETAISSIFEDGTGNVKVCCPIIEIDIDLEDDTYEMTQDEWNALNVEIGGDSTVNGIPDAVKVDASPVGKKPDCINIYMISCDSGGITRIGGPTSVIDPAQVAVRDNLGAHEMGHALGLPANHGDTGGDTDNLNTPHPARSGAKLTKDQCQKIWENIDNYPCT